jgi:hypothetical protein
VGSPPAGGHHAVNAGLLRRPDRDLAGQIVIGTDPSVFARQPAALQDVTNIIP